jgi:hypothetical protein
LSTVVLISTSESRDDLVAWANSLPGQAVEGGVVDYVQSAVLTTSGQWHTLTVVAVLV